MTEAEKFEFKFRLALLYAIAAGALLFAVVYGSGPSGLLGFIALICAYEVQAERKEAQKSARYATTKLAVSRATAIADIINEVQKGKLTKEEAAEKIEQMNE